MTIINCRNCGGDHHGSNVCPFIEAPCVVCGDMTIMACSDCAIDSGGKTSVHVCMKEKCRKRHETTHAPKPSNEVRAAIERVLHSYKAETFGKLLMFLANEDAVMRMMASHDETVSGWRILSPTERHKRVEYMRAALLALAKECEG